MAYPRSLPPTFRPTTERQLETLADHNIGLPLGVIGEGFSTTVASRFLTLWEADAFHGKRPCKKCHAFVLVVSPLHDAAEQFWGKAQTGCLCVPCFRKECTAQAQPPVPEQRPRPVSKPPEATRPNAATIPTPVSQTTPVGPVTVDRFNPPDFQPAPFSAPEPARPVGYYPPYNRPEAATCRFVWYLVKRWDGWLDRESICDLLLGDTVKIFRGDERLRVHPQELEDLPGFGSDMTRYKTAKDRASLERLCDHVLEILCQSREIANHHGVFRAVTRTAPETFSHLTEVIAPPTEPKPVSPAPTEPELRRLYAAAVARAVTELPVHARSREAVRQKTHHLLDRLGRMWNEEHFETAWNEAADARRIA